MSKEYGFKLNLKELAKIGADIPYFINGGFQIGKGIGEILKPIKTKLKLSAVVVKPEHGISTKEAYKNVEMVERPKLRPIIKMIEQDDKIGVIANTFNSFESQV
jgi:4-diphosphocytidyl-2-C-methyl-D-erythritol kinase